MFRNYNLNFFWVVALIFMPLGLCCQELVAAEASKTSPWSIDFDGYLVLIAVVLLIPIYYVGNAFLLSIQQYATKVKSGIDKISSLVIFCLTTSDVFGQAEAVNTVNAGPNLSTFSYLLILLIVFEVLLLIIMSVVTNKFLRNTSTVASGEPAYTYHESLSFWEAFKRKWAKANNFVPVAEEAKLDTGHNYDGIRELDNITPPWFTAAFVISIIFSIIYFYQSHISYSMPSQLQEYEAEIAEAEIQKAKFLDAQSNMIDEKSVVMLTGTDIDAGKALFIQKCAVCHAESGASMPGGVGPNLTDDYWLHGGDIKDIFKTIKYGVPEKGMISWKDQISPKSMAQLSSYIKSIAGINVVGGKEAQGEKYVATTAVTPIDSTLQDSLK